MFSITTYYLIFWKTLLFSYFVHRQCPWNYLHNFLFAIIVIRISIITRMCITCSGFAWLIITGSGLDDWIYWHFFTVTVNYDSSLSMTAHDSLHSLLQHECPLRRVTNDTLNSCWMNYDWYLTNVLLIYEWTLFYNFGRTDERTVSFYSPVATGISLLIFVAAETCVNLWRRFESVFTEPLPRKWSYSSQYCHQVMQMWICNV
jgi:hypothetical protein